MRNPQNNGPTDPRINESTDPQTHKPTDPQIHIRGSAVRPMTIEFPFKIYQAIALRAVRLNTSRKAVVITALKIASLEELYTKKVIKEMQEGINKLLELCKEEYNDEMLSKITIMIEDEEGSNGMYVTNVDSSEMERIEKEADKLFSE